MTTQDLQNKVEAFKQMTAFIKEQNPEVTQVKWEVKDIPYNVFDEYRRKENEKVETGNGNRYKKEYNLGDNMYFYAAQSNSDDGCEVLVWSVPVKFKHTYEVIEQLQAAS